MPIPWTAIIMAIISFFMSKKSGASNTQAALIGAAAGVGSYYLFDPSNPDNLFGVGDAAGKTSADANPPSTGTNGGTGGATAGSIIGGLASQTIDTTGKVLSSWGAAGTAGVIATTAAVTNPDTKKLLLFGALAVGVLLLTR